MLLCECHRGFFWGGGTESQTPGEASSPPEELPSGPGVTRRVWGIDTHQPAPAGRRRCRGAASTSWLGEFPKTRENSQKTRRIPCSRCSGSGRDSAGLLSPAAALSSCSLVGVQAFEITHCWGGFLFRGCACGSGQRGGVSRL